MRTLLILLYLTLTKCKNNTISLTKYISMMDTECQKEFEFNETEDEDTIINLWNAHIEFEWKRAEAREERNISNYPFILCDSTNLTPPDKLNRLLENGLNPSNLMILSSNLISNNITNNNETLSDTCFLINTKSSWCKDIIHNLDLDVIPVSYAMKLLSGSIDRIEELLQVNETMAEDFESINKVDDWMENKNITSDYLDVMLCPGTIINETLSEEELREEVLYHVTTSILEEVLYFMKDSTQNHRQEFWNEILNNEDLQQCEGIYNTLLFEYQSLPLDENVTISTLSINFRTLEQSLEDKLYSNTTISEEERGYVLSLVQTCSQILVLSLSVIPEVCSIQTRPRLEVKNHNAQWLIQTGVQGVTPWYDLGLNGTGEVIAISDTGMSLDHCYFTDGDVDIDAIPRNFGRPFTLNMRHRKVVQYDDYVNAMDMNYGHGSHVAATLAGCKPDGSGISRGVAYGAKLAFLDIGFQDGKLASPSTDRLLDTGRPYAKIHSASWGSTLPVYGVQAWLMDTYIYNANDEMLLLFAAGNDGDGDKPSTVGEPATAKNILAVGASHSVGSGATRDMLGPSYIASFSSRGPTRDGRTKPDILAPGKWISSAAARNDMTGECDPGDGVPPSPNDAKEGLVSFQGTSMSTPVVAGAAALIRQYLREGYYPTGEKNETNVILNPSAALLKAILLNGAQYMNGVDNDLKGITPVAPYDNTQNFGRVSLVDSLYLKGKSNVQTVFKDRVEIFNGATKFFEVVIDTSGGCTNPTFSATLVWTDRPALPGCLQCLINNLDLSLVRNKDQSSQVFHPNGRSEPDKLNNAERIRLSNVKHNDTITMYVSAANLMTPTQQFSIVASGCMMGAQGNTINMKEGDVFANDDSAEKRRENILMGIFIPVGLVAVGAIGYYFYNGRRLRYG